MELIGYRCVDGWREKENLFWENLSWELIALHPFNADVLLSICNQFKSSKCRVSTQRTAYAITDYLMDASDTKWLRYCSICKKKLDWENDDLRFVYFTCSVSTLHRVGIIHLSWVTADFFFFLASLCCCFYFGVSGSCHFPVFCISTNGESFVLFPLLLLKAPPIFVALILFLSGLSYREFLRTLSYEFRDSLGFKKLLAQEKGTTFLTLLLFV